MSTLPRKRRVIEALKKIFSFVLLVAVVGFVIWLICREPDASYPSASAQPKPLISPWEPLP